ncbi:MAG: hypothetical protein KJI72_00165 [Patescibacteria group bacterium]|nr:hypothetical protein [Patescibacteria group bacterium]
MYIVIIKKLVKDKRKQGGVEVEQTIEQTIFEQRIENENFDPKKVIAAVNSFEYREPQKNPSSGNQSPPGS